MVSTMDTVGYIRTLHDKWKFTKIFIDDAGIGGGLTDYLKEVLGDRLVIGLNNSSRSIDTTGRKKKLLKEDLYSNALVLMERGNLSMISNLSLIQSLRNMTFEYTAERNLRIHGRDSHLAEAFVRSCWSIRQKGLKLFLA